MIRAERSLSPRPLIVTDDVDLLDDMLRMAAAANVEVDVAASTSAASPRWQQAGLILLGADVVPGVQEADLPRRRDVVLVGNGTSTAAWNEAARVGASQVLNLPDAETWLLDRLASLAVTGVSQAPVLAVIGACGGAGASTLAAAVAITATRSGTSVAAVDLDAHSWGVGCVLGATAGAGTTWRELARVRGRIPPGPLVAGLPEVDGVRALSFGDHLPAPPKSAVMASVLDALRLGVDLVVVDLPRYCPEAAAGAVLSRATRSVLLVPLEGRALHGASRLLERRVVAQASTGLVTRGSTAGADPADVAAALGLQLDAHMRADRAASRDAELGLAPALRRSSPLARAAEQILGVLDNGTAP